MANDETPDLRYVEDVMERVLTELYGPGWEETGFWDECLVCGAFYVPGENCNCPERTGPAVPDP